MKSVSDIAVVRSVRDLFNLLPSFHRYLLLLILAMLLVAALMPVSKLQDITLEADLDAVDMNVEESFADVAVPGLSLPDYEYQIAPGDTLSAIFELLRISQRTMYQVLESDLSILALDTLKPGDNLRFWINRETGELTKLELAFSLAHQVVFTRVDNNSFEYQEVLLPGDWKNELVAGEINGSFYLSAKRAGLTALDIQRISSLFKDKMNFKRDLRAGDSFQVIRSSQYIDGQPTGDSKVEGIRILNRKRELTAFLFDGSYYDRKGESLARAFMRYPVSKRYRISSSFNPRRKHPVTGRIRPHNGTDFATPRGTPVMATGDGVVTRVTKHPYAGLYIVIQHGQKYRTRFLHLRKSLVSKGQTVSRGQKIALSGNSGRSTGPHLHYELHVNGRPVNAMKAPIPVAASISKKDRKAFSGMVNSFIEQMKAG